MSKEGGLFYQWVCRRSFGLSECQVGLTELVGAKRKRAA